MTLLIVRWFHLKTIILTENVSTIYGEIPSLGKIPYFPGLVEDLPFKESEIF